MSFQKKATVFAQGDSTDGLFFIQIRESAPHRRIGGWKGGDAGHPE